ncbi:MAG TPA: hypothetical protein VEO95_05825 [Chthoniobacteraceae bacterium]|nr:hypothetical protein [Chthoniobacteraceae bacterium]
MIPHHFASHTAELEPENVLTVVTIYEDEPALHRAERTVERVLEGAEDGTIARRAAWNFATVADGAADFEAREWLAVADIVMVAARRHLEAPPAIAEWLADGLGDDMERPRALVALGMVSPQNLTLPKALFASLEPVAAQLGMRWFCSTVSVQSEDSNQPAK